MCHRKEEHTPMTDVTAGSARAAQLRPELADELVARDTATKEVGAAFRQVPRSATTKAPSVATTAIDPAATQFRWVG